MIDHSIRNSQPLPKILLIHGSPVGSNGNSHLLSRALIQALGGRAQTTDLYLKQNLSSEVITTAIQNADAFVFTTGTYWDSWGSPLQKFLEDFTRLEGSPLYLGKPAAVLVTMHSVGGKEVLSRLQGVLNTLGIQIPPMSGIAYSYAAQLAMDTEAGKAEPDFWSVADLKRIAHNLLVAVERNRNAASTWNAWDFDARDPHKLWVTPN